jgi:hypothetical protein
MHVSLEKYVFFRVLVSAVWIFYLNFCLKQFKYCSVTEAGVTLYWHECTAISVTLLLQSCNYEYHTVTVLQL